MIQAPSDQLGRGHISWYANNTKMSMTNLFWITVIEGVRRWNAWVWSISLSETTGSQFQSNFASAGSASKQDETCVDIYNHFVFSSSPKRRCCCKHALFWIGAAQNCLLPSSSTLPTHCTQLLDSALFLSMPLQCVGKALRLLWFRN